jgi:hypothetical protein
MSQSAASIIAARKGQMFPTLGRAEIDRLHRFGETKSYARGARVVKAGEVAPGLIVILSGKAEVTQGDGFGQRKIIVTRPWIIPWRTGPAVCATIPCERRGRSSDRSARHSVR